MMFRLTDKKAKAAFEKLGINLYTRTVQLNGFNLHYVQVGKDSLPTLVFIHGSPGSWSAFEQYLKDKDLQARFRLISVDRPGFGYSEFGVAMNLEDQAALLSAFIQSIENAQKLYLIGHSLGGPLAVKLGIQNKGIVSGLVLLAAAVDPKEEKPEKWRPVLIYTPLRFLVPGAFRPSNEELWYLKKDLYSVKTDLNGITCPVWVFQGNKDSFVPPGNAHYAQKQLLHSSSVSMHFLPGANHFIPWTHYQEIKKVLLELPYH
ncbi:MAG TPA: alpha/beta hydrolase [Flavisolibacter sp.]|nr:alpha/beta hydrolase [Flavisolibacter sp.]